ncbi:hypothetical protein MJC1_00569 [Methylocystis sp. MJC1]|nr:hypothetical protein MJC1_00569 [Methylocystis sp. MJC1]
MVAMLSCFAHDRLTVSVLLERALSNQKVEPTNKDKIEHAPLRVPAINAETGAHFHLGEVLRALSARSSGLVGPA